MKNTIEILYHNEKCKVEQHGDWIDLRASKDYQYKAGDSLMIDLGVSMKIPSTAYMLPRSSTFKNYGIIMTNSMGVIDTAYCGNDDVWHFPAYALRDGEIHEGDRIAQFCIGQPLSPMQFKEVTELNAPSRGGFGSTGVK